MSYHNRYETLTENGVVTFFPDIILAEKDTDKMEIYQSGKTRFDKLSAKYYGAPYYDFLIKLANPEVDLEFTISNETVIRIPLPLDATLKELKDKVEEKLKLYGG